MALCTICTIMYTLHTWSKIYFAKSTLSYILHNMTAQEIKNWRTAKRLSQDELGTMLGVSHAAVNRWEGGQEVPGPAAKLLRMLIYGEQPFPHLPGEEDNAFYQVSFTLFEWEELERRRIAQGFPNVREYLAHVIRQNLKQTPAASARGREPVMLKVAEDPEAYGKQKGA